MVNSIPQYMKRRHRRLDLLILPDDIAIKIVSLLEQPTGLCSLSCCSRFWRDLCNLDLIWKSRCTKRWPSLFLSNHSVSDSDSAFPQKSQNTQPPWKGWREFYRDKHTDIANKVAPAVKSVKESSGLCMPLGVFYYLQAITRLSFIRIGFKDVHMLFFNPCLKPLLNLVGLHYCIHWLQVPRRDVLEALQSCKISERKVCVTWVKRHLVRGYWIGDEGSSGWVSLADLATVKEDVLILLRDCRNNNEISQLRLTCL